MRAATIVTLLVGVLAGASLRDGVELRAQTQSQMNADAGRQLRSAEAEMADLLQALRKKASGHPDALARLERAQSAWVSYRDAHIGALWPSKTPASHGSVFPTCVSTERTRLTKDRIRELRLMLAAETGDVCFGAWPE